MLRDAERRAYRSNVSRAVGRGVRSIDTAKDNQLARLGPRRAKGKRRRCSIGKSCGASCIQRSKVCMVDLPWVSAGLSSLSNSITRRYDNTPKKELKRNLEYQRERLRETKKESKKYMGIRRVIKRIINSLVKRLPKQRV